MKPICTLVVVHTSYFDCASHFEKKSSLKQKSSLKFYILILKIFVKENFHFTRPESLSSTLANLFHPEF